MSAEEADRQTCDRDCRLRATGERPFPGEDLLLGCRRQFVSAYPFARLFLRRFVALIASIYVNSQERSRIIGPRGISNGCALQIGRRKSTRVFRRVDGGGAESY